MELPLAWQLLCAALVLFMTPGLAFFYGGLVKAKSVVSMAMLSFGAMGIVSVLWVLYGFNIGFIAGDKTDLIPFDKLEAFFTEHLAPGTRVLEEVTAGVA